MTVPLPSLDRRNLLAQIAALTAWPVLAGCQARTPLGVVAHPWIGYETLFLAQQLGWWPDPAWATLKRTPDAAASEAALRAGTAQAAALTLDELLRLRDEGLPLVVVLVFAVSAGADVVFSRHPLPQLADMRGARIGLEQGALGELMLAALLTAAGLQRADVQTVPLAPSEQSAAWQAQRVDMLITYEPTASRLRKLGAHTVFDSRDMPNTIFDVLAVTPAALTTHPSALTRVVAAHFKALTHMRQHPQDVIHRIAALQQVTAQDVHSALRGVELPALDGNRLLLSGPSPRMVEAAQTLGTLMHRHGLLKQVPSLDNLVDVRLIEQALVASTPP